jgi:peptidoglycan hydrolase CwlO-like protein
MPSGLPSSVHLPVLSGLAAATAAVTPDQLQQEQRVLGAWQQVQQQRQLALRAMVAAERANAELFQARAEAAEAQAAAQAAAAAQPHSPEPRQSGNGASSEAGGRPAGVRLVPAGCGADLKTLAASVRQVSAVLLQC